MRVTGEVFWLQKAGNSVEEYEDSYFPPYDFLDVVSDFFQFAIADGVSNSVFGGVWARLLTNRLVAERSLINKDIRRIPSRRFLNMLRPIWANEVKKYLEENREKLKLIYEEICEKVERGTGATFFRLLLYENRTWETYAIGDCNIFIVRDNKLLKAWPLTDPSQFDNFPDMITTYKTRLTPAFSHARGVWEKNDEFFLMTDALACWFLEEYKKGNKPWQILPPLECVPNPKSKDYFNNLIIKLRENRAISDDDTTLIHVMVR